MWRVAVISRSRTGQFWGPALVERLECRTLAREAGKQGGRLPPLTQFAMERRYTRVDVCQADAVRVEHRSTAPGGEAVAVRVDHVDVGGAAGVAFVEHARTFIDE